MKLRPLFLLFIFIVTISAESYAQIDSLPQERFSQTNFDNQINHYLKKSKNQKKLAWIFLGGGLAVNLVGSSLTYSNNSTDPGGAEVLSSVGGLAAYASIPLFFASSKNKNKAQLLYFQKSIDQAGTDSIRQIYVEDASEYFKVKARANTTTAIVMTSLGTAAIIGGAIASSNNNNNFDGFFDDPYGGTLLIVTGVVVDLVSIPFYVRAARHRNYAKAILRTGRIPSLGVGAVSPTINTGKYVAVGIAIQL